jgi:hypothetical protein
MGGIWKRITGKITDQPAAGGQAVTTEDMQAEGAPSSAATDQPAGGTDGQQTPPQQGGSA